MTTEIDMTEKLEIVNQHIKNLQLSMYSLELSRLEENYLTYPNPISLNEIQSQIDDTDAKIEALLAQRDLLIG